MFWRGVTWTSPDRRQLLEAIKDHPDIADVMEMSWGGADHPVPEDFVSGLEMCAWKYIIYTEGTTSLCSDSRHCVQRQTKVQHALLVGDYRSTATLV
jgi:hypothetical protein